MVIKDKNDLFQLVEASVGKQLRLFVYNWTNDACREVTIIPDPNWGGDGSLGCDIGFGLLYKYGVVGCFNRKS